MANTSGKRAPETEPGMRLLKIAVVVMGVLIIGGTAALVVLIAHRLSASHSAAAVSPTQAALPPSSPGPASSGLDEPNGSRIVAISRVSNGLALAITGGGEPDRLVVIDPASGQVLLRLRITH